MKAKRYYRRHGDVRLRPNRPGPGRAERRLQIDELRESLAPLSSGNRWRVGFVGEHGSVDDVGALAFEDAKGFHAAVATVRAPLEQFTSRVGNTGLESRRCGVVPR
jgi:hypothetical protein